MPTLTESQLRRIIREEIINEIIPRKISSFKSAMSTDTDMNQMAPRRTSSKPAKHPRPIPTRDWYEEQYEEPKVGQKWSRGGSYRPDYDQYKPTGDSGVDLLMVTAVDMKTVSIVMWLDDYIPNSGGRKQQTNIKKRKIPRLQWTEWLTAGNWAIQHDSPYYENYPVPKF